MATEENKQLSLLDQIKGKEIEEEVDSEDFVEMMDKIKALPYKDWLKLFK